MNKTRHTNRLGMVALLSVILGAGILFAGCDKPPEAVKKPVTKVETKAPPAKAAPAVETPDKQAEKAQFGAEESLLMKIANENDIFSLHDIKKEYEQREEKSEAVVKALDARWDAIAGEIEPKTLVDGLDFLAIDMKPAGEGKAEFSVLLRTTADIDTDYQLTIVGRVDPSHKSKLSEAARRMRDREIWSVLPWDYKESEWKASDMSKWKANEYHVLSLIATAAPIPYDLSITMQIWDNGKWAANAGNVIKLGWHAALEE